MFKWALTALAIIAVSIAVFILAAALFPGDPGRFYLIVSLVLLALTLGWRILGFPMR